MATMPPALPTTARPALWLVPGRALVLFFVQVEQGPLATLSVAPGRFLDGLATAAALLGFTAPQRAEPVLEELLPWAGNV